MLDPFSFWQRMLSASADLARTNRRSAEILLASRDVIERRSAIIGEAIARPLEADHAELMRMGPEKVVAFSQVGIGMMADCWAAQRAWMVEWSNLGTMMARGRMPTPGEMATQASRSLSFAMGTAERAVRSQGKALTPIHKGVTRNAKRLARKPAAKV